MDMGMALVAQEGRAHQGTDERDEKRRVREGDAYEERASEFTSFKSKRKAASSVPT